MRTRAHARRAAAVGVSAAAALPLLAAAILLLHAPAAGAARQPPAPKEVYYRYSFPQGVYLDQIPGATKLNPRGLVPGISLTLAPVIYEGPTNARKLFKFTGMGYVDDSTGLTNMFAPTMRLKRGMLYVVKITNALVQPREHEFVNWIHNPGDTNLHTHGIHAQIGVPSQDTATTYLYGDNVFNTIPARNSTRYPPQFRIFNLQISGNQMPGLHWVHPHQHGSTALQVGTAHGMIVIEDDNDHWLPPSTNCSEFRAVIEQAQDVLLDIQLFYFQKADPNVKVPSQITIRNYTINVDKKINEYSKYIDSVNNGNYLFYSENSLYPNQYGVGRNKASGRATTADKGRGLNVLTVNGAYQPVVRMPSGLWQRWRMLFSGVKGFFVLTIYDKATNQTTNACEIMLYAKDGIYLQELPRRIEGIFLGAASRAEVLIRCAGAPGARYVVTSRTCHPFSINCFGYQPDIPVNRVNHIGPFFQDTVWEIEVTEPPPLAPTSPLRSNLTERRCVPLRPGYAVDLRDEALAAANVDTDTQMDTYSVGYAPLYLNNTPAGLPQEAFSYACAYAVNDSSVGERFVFPDSAPLVLEMGKVVQWNFADTDFHPMHVHINPYMIAHLNDSWLFQGSSWANFFEAGDFHDTLTLP